LLLPISDLNVAGSFTRGLETHQVRIYLIDDEPIVLNTISGFLADLGHSVTCAASGESLDAIADEPVADLVITDLRLPEANGLTLIRRIHELLPNTPIVVISGHREALLDLRDTVENYVHAFLQKPFSLSELEDLLTRLSKDRREGRLEIRPG
jgi:two-component system C4-dicarboxylate transport response regulator DctD